MQVTSGTRLEPNWDNMTYLPAAQYNET